jgi:hypothetical protein
MRVPSEGKCRAFASSCTFVTTAPPAPPFCVPHLELLDLGLPFAIKADVVAYDRHILLASDDPAGATRHRAPSPISTTRIEEAFVYKTPEQLVGWVFAQADALAYACKRVWAPPRVGK